MHANSLYSVIADGKYRATPLGRNACKTPIAFQASMLFAALSLAEQKLVPLRTTKMLAAAVTLEFSFLQLDMVMVMVMNLYSAFSMYIYSNALYKYVIYEQRPDQYTGNSVPCSLR